MTSKKSDLDENPYEPPESESARSTPSRRPSISAWIAVIIAALVSGGFAFFVTCYGVLVLGSSMRILDTNNAFGSISMFLLLTLPFVAFIFAVVGVIRLGGKSIK